MKRIIFILFFLTPLSSFANDMGQNYSQYHLSIIDAEKEIFINKNGERGLEIFKRTFEEYDFVFVDDCVEAFQLALFFHKEDFALAFIKKALENGFELKFLDQLSLGCPCNLYKDQFEKKNVTIHKSFIASNKSFLEEYSSKVYPKYLQRINRDLVYGILKRHVREQLFKSYHSEMLSSWQEQREQYLKISENNIVFIDSLAKHNYFMGERNLGLYTEKLIRSLNFPFKTIEDYALQLLKFYNLPLTTYIPFNNEKEYFGINPIYTIMFHNKNSFNIISKYASQAIQTGFIHPREFASLESNLNLSRDSQLYLQPSNNRLPVNIIIIVDERRRKFLLPSYEIDYQKHLFAHKNNLKLFFGFRNATK